MGFARYIFKLSQSSREFKSDWGFGASSRQDRVKAEVLLNVPYAAHGFENSCSECSAEMVLKYWDVIEWDQFSIHKAGFQTYEGGIAEGDYGLKNLFLCNQFKTKEKTIIEFDLHEFKKGTLKDLRAWLDRKVPIIVRVSPNPMMPQNKHTFVIIGYNKMGFIKHDNDMGANLFLPNEEVIKEWKPPHYLIVYPKGFISKEIKKEKCKLGGK